MKITLIIDLECDESLFDLDSAEEKEWFIKHILGDELVIHSNVLGCEIGTAMGSREQV